MQLCYDDKDEISLPTKCNISVPLIAQYDNNEYTKQTFTATCPTSDLHQDCSLSEKSLPKCKQKLRNIIKEFRTVNYQGVHNKV
jgi:hypothetical protein